MINKAFTKIESNDFLLLIENGVPESKTIEYKKVLPDESSDSRKEFLADISSFANAEGGDIIYGIRSEKGVPIEITGLNIIDNDKVKLQWDNVIRDGISPRIKVDIEIFEVQQKQILLIRILKSWNKPHRIEYKNYQRFYSRNSAGKYLLDVDELRSAFLSTHDISEKIHNFIYLRNNAILNDEAMLPLEGKAKLVFYLIPMDSFLSTRKLNIFSIKDKLWPPSCNGCSSRINLEGYMKYSRSSNESSYSYVQIYRNGIIEAVNSSLLYGCQEEDKSIPGYDYEREIIDSVRQYLIILKDLEVYPPIVFGLSFINIRDYVLAFDRSRFSRVENIKFGKDLLQLPEIIINEYSDEIEKLLKDVFDSVWNTFGIQRSLNYDNNGQWKG